MQVARVSGKVVSGLAVVMRPVIWFLSFSTNSILKLLRLKTEGEQETVTEEEIRMMVDLGEERGTIATDEGKWIDNVFEFGESDVSDIMTHVSEMVAIAADESPDEILQVIRKSGLSRIPIYKKNVDDIIGILNVRDFLLERRDDWTELPQALIRPAYFVPETVPATTLFKDMQQKKVHFAVVIDEYGQTGGFVTMEDLLEEIVGSIYDEFDPAEERTIEKLDDNLWRVAGSAELEELAEELHVELPQDEDIDTLNGLVLSQINHIPKDGTEFDVSALGLNIHVDKFARRRVVSATVEKRVPAMV
jgi:putative hemolysin